jgi:hypothetical protein
MTLPTAQQRVLDSIDHSLRAREPRLASMFDMFTRLTAGETRPAWEQLTSSSGRRLWRARRRASQPARSTSGGSGGSGRLRRSGASGGALYRVLILCPLVTVLAVLGILVGLSPDLVPASCRTSASVTPPAAHVAGWSCQNLIPAK